MANWVFSFFPGAWRFEEDSAAKSADVALSSLPRLLDADDAAARCRGMIEKSCKKSADPLRCITVFQGRLHVDLPYLNFTTAVGTALDLFLGYEDT